MSERSVMFLTDLAIQLAEKEEKDSVVSNMTKLGIAISALPLNLLMDVVSGEESDPPQDIGDGDGWGADADEIAAEAEEIPVDVTRPRGSSRRHPCDYASWRARDGSRCGGRSATNRPGGRL